MSISVLINGAAGRMGQAAVATISAHDNLSLAGCAGRGDDLARVIAELNPQVVLDFTCAQAVFANAKLIIDAGVTPVIGSSGLLAEQVSELQALAAAKNVSGMIVPNFCIGAVLMMRFAEQAAKFYPHAEIIEYHHNKKQESPSGTAVKTAAMLSDVRANQRHGGDEMLAGARGANLNDVPIHAVRLPGLLAHQEVLFGSEGELLTIRHDSFNREAYMPGVCLACEQAGQLNELVYGLEHLLR
jgi:4-hydroxy-tetrahydrodipicolinate reductase